ncbi:hypothetical protein, partial [Burkholderia cepacia]|uniref:hypothetical protein n=1 Tax=Burkholderia cepacia TaxID=292 RepID=UPI001E558B3F
MQKPTQDNHLIFDQLVRAQQNLNSPPKRTIRLRAIAAEKAPRRRDGAVSAQKSPAASRDARKSFKNFLKNIYFDYNIAQTSLRAVSAQKLTTRSAHDSPRRAHGGENHR